MTRHRSLVRIFPALCILLSGCMHFMIPSPSRECAPWFTDDFRNKTDTAWYIVQQATPEELFQLYMCRRKSGQRSNTTWIDMAKQNNIGVVQYIKQTIDGINDSVDLGFTLEILSYINWRNYYPVSRDDELRRSIQVAICRLKKYDSYNYNTTVYQQIYSDQSIQCQ